MNELMSLAQRLRRIRGVTATAASELDEVSDRLEAIAKAQAEPVAWATADGPLPTKAAADAVRATGATVFPLYAAPPSPAVTGLVEALERVEAYPRRRGDLGYETCRRIAKEALAKYRSATK